MDNFPSTKLPRGLYLEGRFNGRLFGLTLLQPGLIFRDLYFRNFTVVK